MAHINTVAPMAATSRLVSGLHLAFAAGGRRSWPGGLAEPERDAKADQQHGPEQEEDDGLLQPGYRGNRKAHRKAEKGDLQRKETDAGEEGAEREQYEEDEAGGRGREQLLNARYKHDVHRDQYGDPVQRLGPDQPPPGLFAIDLWPLVDDADDTDGKRQKLPVANERLVRSVGVGDARDGEPQRYNVGQLLPQKMNYDRASLGGFRAIAPLGFNSAHDSPTFDCLGLFEVVAKVILHVEPDDRDSADHERAGQDGRCAAKDELGIHDLQQQARLFG